MVCQTYLALSLSVFINLYSIDWQGSYHLYLLNSFSLMGVLIGVLIPIFFFNLVFANRRRFDVISFTQRYRTVFADLQTNSPW